MRLTEPLSFDDISPALKEPLSFDDIPAEPAPPPAPQVSAPAPVQNPQDAIDPTIRKILLQAEPLAKGAIGAVTGLPDLAVSAPILARNLLSEDRKWSDDLFPITNTAFGLAGKARDALGIPNVEPQTLKERALYNALEFGTGAVSGPGAARAAAGLLKKAAPAVSKVAPALGENLADPLTRNPNLFRDVITQNIALERAAAAPNSVAAVKEVLKPSAALAASGVGGGLGYTAMGEVFPDSPIAQLAGAVLGSSAGPGLANFVASPVTSTKNALENRKMEFDFAGPDKFENPPTKKLVDRAAKIFQDFTGDETARSQAVNNIDEGLKYFEGSGVMPTTGTVSDNAGLLQLEKSARLSRDPSVGASFIERDRNLAQQNIEDFKKIAPDEKGALPVTAETVRGSVDEIRDAAQIEKRAADKQFDTAVKTAEELKTGAVSARERVRMKLEGRLNSSESELKKIQEGNFNTRQDLASTPRMDRETAGSALVEDVIQPAKDAKKQEYQELIREFETDKTPVNVNFDPDDLSKLNRYRSVFGESGGYAGLIKSVSDLVVSKNPPLSEFLAMEQDVNRAIRQARSAGDGNAAAALSNAKNIIETNLERASPKNAEKFRKAREFYRTNIAEPFIQGTTGKVLAAGAKGEIFKNSVAESVPAFFQKGPKGGEAIDQLLQTAPKDKIQPVVRDYLIDDIIKNNYNEATNTFNTRAIRKFITDRPEAFQRFPEIRTEIHQMLNKLESGKALEDIAGEGVSSAKMAIKQGGSAANKFMRNREEALNNFVSQVRRKTDEMKLNADKKVREAEKSAAKFFLDNTEPSVAIEKAFADTGNLTKNISELISIVKRDSSGKALNGLKEGVFDHIQEKISSENLALGKGEGALDFKKTNKLLRAYRAALEDSGLYSKEELNVLKTVSKRMEISQRGNLRVTAGSDATEKTALSEGEKILLRSGLRAQFGGLRGGNLFSVINDMLDVVTGARKRAEIVGNVMVRSHLDPELGKLLLKRNLNHMEKSTYRRRLLNMIPTMAAETFTEDDEKKF